MNNHRRQLSAESLGVGVGVGIGIEPAMRTEYVAERGIVSLFHPHHGAW